MIFTAWGKDGVASCLVPGDQRPGFEDGTPIDDCPDLIWTIEADSWEAVTARYHELQGWEAWKP